MSDDNARFFVFLFPFVVDGLLAALFPFLSGRRKWILLAVCGYILFNFVLPIFLGLRQFPEEKIWIVVSVLIFRAIELFGFRVLGMFLGAWLYEGPPRDIKQALKTAKQNREASAPILKDLAQAGFRVDRIYEIGERKRDYKKAVPVLMHWLPRVDSPDVKGEIAMALTVPWAGSEAAPLLIDEFRKAPASEEFGVKVPIGDALTVVADDSVFSEIVELVRDRRHGKSRMALILALGNMRNPEAVDVLIALLDDESMIGPSLVSLGKLEAEKARPQIETFLTHPSIRIRIIAKKALARIDKASRKKAKQTKG